MKLLEKYFDHYDINARIKVAFFISFPAIVTILVWIPQAKGWGATLITMLVTFGCLRFFSNTISNLGNDLQKKLYQQWGGEPTTALLRHRDTTIDPYTKARIHSWLQKSISTLKMPSTDEEENNPEDADNRYKSVVHYLREKTRDRKKFNMVYRDLVAYGFARNVLALKTLGIIISIMILVINSALIFYKYSDVSVIANLINRLDLTALLVLSVYLTALAFLFIYSFQVNQKHVQQRAERYAKSLLAVCDQND